MLDWVFIVVVVITGLSGALTIWKEHRESRQEALALEEVDHE